VVSLPYRAPQQSDAPRPVPDVTGRSIREAALALHRRGFRVSLRGLGRVVRTVPEAGQSARPGSAVLVLAE
jgi:beta-lactam-binding protein with PASTA domain